jgi:predicted nucleotidyltransferase
MSMRDDIAVVVRRLGTLQNRVIFVGGSTIELLISDKSAAPVRATDDVDLIMVVGSRLEFLQEVSEQLRHSGFKPELRDDAPACRWIVDGVTVDIMPTRAEILGFTNRWYEPSVAHAVWVHLSDDLKARIMSAPYFIASKLEAFKGRGNGDFIGSADIEDVIAILDGRFELLDEVRAASQELQSYLAQEASALLRSDDFADAVEGFFRSDAASQRRRTLLRLRLEQLASSSP